MTDQFNIRLTCMPGRRNISGNCRADKLVMLRTILQMQRSLETVDIALANLKLIMLQNAVFQLTNRIQNDALLNIATYDICRNFGDEEKWVIYHTIINKVVYTRFQLLCRSALCLLKAMTVV